MFCLPDFDLRSPSGVPLLTWSAVCIDANVLWRAFIIEKQLMHLSCSSLFAASYITAYVAAAVVTMISSSDGYKSWQVRDIRRDSVEGSDCLIIGFLGRSTSSHRINLRNLNAPQENTATKSEELRVTQPEVVTNRVHAGQLRARVNDRLEKARVSRKT